MPGAVAGAGKRHGLRVHRVAEAQFVRARGLTKSLSEAICPFHPNRPSRLPENGGAAKGNVLRGLRRRP